MSSSSSRLSTRLVVSIALTLAGLGIVGSVYPASHAGAADAPVSVFHYSSEPGDSVGQGQSATFDSRSGATFTPSGFMVTGSRNDIIIEVRQGSTEDWQIRLVGSDIYWLQAGGSYRDVVSPSWPHPSNPAMSISGDGRGCSTPYGGFDVKEIQYTTDGNVASLDATFTQRCDLPNAPAIYGRIQFNVDPAAVASDLPTPLPSATATATPDPLLNAFAYIDEPGGWNHPGGSGSYTGVRITGLVSPERVNIDVQYLNFTLVAPRGRTLTPGTYDIAVDPARMTGDEAGMKLALAHCDFPDYGGDFGSFTINSISYSSTGHPSLDATFIERCNTSTGPALRAVVHFNVDPATASPLTVPPADPVVGQSSYEFDRGPGNGLAGSQHQKYDASNSIIMLYGDPSRVSVVTTPTENPVSWQEVSFIAPPGQALKVGTYENVVQKNPRLPIDSSSPAPGMEVFSDSCTGMLGRFTVYGIHADRFGMVDQFEAGFTVQCPARVPGTYYPPITGLIRYRVTDPKGPSTVKAAPLPGMVLSKASATPPRPQALALPSSAFPSGAPIAGAEASNAQAEQTPFRALHTKSYAALGRTGGLLQTQSQNGTTFTALSSIYPDSATAQAAMKDTIPGFTTGGTFQGTDCSRSAGTACTMSQVRAHGSTSTTITTQVAIMRFAQCTLETGWTVTNGNWQDKTALLRGQLRIAFGVLSSACRDYDANYVLPYVLQIQSAHLLACVPSGSSSSCATAIQGSVKAGTITRAALGLRVQNQPTPTSYTIRQSVLAPGSKKPQVSTVKRTVPATLTRQSVMVQGPALRLSKRGRWTLSLRVTGGGASSQTRTLKVIVTR